MNNFPSQNLVVDSILNGIVKAKNNFFCFGLMIDYLYLMVHIKL